MNSTHTGAWRHLATFLIVFSMLTPLNAASAQGDTTGTNDSGSTVISTPVDDSTLEPVNVPTLEPTTPPTLVPNEEPTAEATQEPTAEPTLPPTIEPTVAPTEVPLAPAQRMAPMQEPVAVPITHAVFRGSADGSDWYTTGMPQEFEWHCGDTVYLEVVVSNLTVGNLYYFDVGFGQNQSAANYRLSFPYMGTATGATIESSYPDGAQGPVVYRVNFTADATQATIILTGELDCDPGVDTAFHGNVHARLNTGGGEQTFSIVGKNIVHIEATLPSYQLTYGQCIAGEDGLDSITMTADGAGVLLTYYNFSDQVIDNGLAGVLAPGAYYVLATLQDGYVWPTTPPTGWTAVTDTDGVTVIGYRLDLLLGSDRCMPALALGKTADAASYEPGATITYTIVVTNFGNGTATGVSVWDVLPGNLEYVEGSVTPTATCSYDSDVRTIRCLDLDVPYATDDDTPGTVTITFQASVPIDETVCGNVTNTAEGGFDGRTETGEAWNGTAPVTVNINCMPGVNASKTSVVDEGADNRISAGDVVTYTIVISNTGNTSLHGVLVGDELTKAGVAVEPIALSGDGYDQATGTVAEIPIGEAVTLTGTYVLTQADIDGNGTQFINCVDVANDTHPADDCTEDIFVGEVGLNAAKTSELKLGSDGMTAGDTIDYAVTVTNTGTITLTNVLVEDVPSGMEVPAEIVLTGDGYDAATGVIGKIPVGQSVTLTGSYTITQGDIDNQTAIQNCVLVAGDEIAIDDCTWDGIVTTPGLNAAKKAVLNSGNNGLDAGDTISYTIVVTNSGNTTIKNVKVTDQLTGTAIPATVKLTGSGYDPVTSVVGEILVGQTITLTGSYTITQSDIDGEVTIQNCVIVEGDVASSDNCTLTSLTGQSMVDIEKVADIATYSGAGTTISYTLVVTNTGSTTLTGVNVADLLDGLSTLVCVDHGATDSRDDDVTVKNGEFALQPGQQVVCTATYKVTATDVAAGKVVNTGSVTTDQQVTDNDTVTVVHQVPTKPPVKQEPAKVTILPKTGTIGNLTDPEPYLALIALAATTLLIGVGLRFVPLRKR